MNHDSILAQFLHENDGLQISNEGQISKEGPSEDVTPDTDYMPDVDGGLVFLFYLRVKR
jgi:hypothetical protein